MAAPCCRGWEGRVERVWAEKESFARARPVKIATWRGEPEKRVKREGRARFSGLSIYYVFERGSLYRSVRVSRRSRSPARAEERMKPERDAGGGKTEEYGGASEDFSGYSGGVRSISEQKSFR